MRRGKGSKWGLGGREKKEGYFGKEGKGNAIEGDIINDPRPKRRTTDRGKGNHFTQRGRKRIISHLGNIKIKTSIFSGGGRSVAKCDSKGKRWNDRGGRGT